MEYEHGFDPELALVQQVVMEECLEYVNNVARSAEEGWFYADEKGE